MIIVPFDPSVLPMVQQTLSFMIATVGAGEIISCYLLGMLLYGALKK